MAICLHPYLIGCRTGSPGSARRSTTSPRTTRYGSATGEEIVRIDTIRRNVFELHERSGVLRDGAARLLKMT